MIKHRPSLSLPVAASVVCALVSACDQPETVVATDVAIVATANDVAITELDMTLATGSAGGHEAGVAAPDPQEILQRIILQELASQKAIAAGLDTDDVYQENLRRVEAQIAAFKRKALSDLFYERELANRSDISDVDARDYFDDNVDVIAADIRIWQILRRDEELISQDHASLQNGETFEQVAARRFADMPQVIDSPWDLGYLKWEQIPEAWWDTIDELGVGDTSDVIRGPNNRFWIIKVVDKRTNPDIDYTEVETRIKEVLRSQRVRRFREDLNTEMLREARIEYPD